MLVKHVVLVTKGEKNIGRFTKLIDMSGLPPVGCVTNFGETFGGFQVTAKQVSYFEQEELYSVFYTVDVFDEQDRLKDYISDDYYPKKLVNNCGFSIDWLEAEYEGIF